MVKQVINVPDNIEHISDWKEFSFPQGHNILDKTICGCGLTEYCLRNDLPVVLCSPRKVLLENKEDQHNNMTDPVTGERIPNPNPEFPVYYFRNDADPDVFDSDPKDKDAKEIRLSYLREIKQNLVSWVRSISNYHAPKILVTYDSLHHVLDAITAFPAMSFFVVVDEFQAIFTDSAFKAQVELDFLEDLKYCRDVLYVSATPMLEKYLDQLDYFKDLPFYKLAWPENMTEKVRIKRITTRSINNELSKYINMYRRGSFINKVVAGKIYESKELAVFCNSVKTICDVIKKNGLQPEECNILCSDSTSNQAKIKKLGKGFEIGKVPTKGAKHKMFTFCTRTVYLGADFYSTCAFTIICSDCNIKTLIVDISLDLPQIVGRQRLKENVFKNEVLFLYKAEVKDRSIINISKDEFINLEKERDEKSSYLLSLYDKGNEAEKRAFIEKVERDSEPYAHDFVGISKSGKLVYNFLVKLSAQRAWDVSREDYQDEVCLKRGMEAAGFGVEDNFSAPNDMQEVYQEFVSHFSSSTFFEDRMRVLCTYMSTAPELFSQYGSTIMTTLVPLEYQNYISLLGPDKIRALKYSEKAITQEISNITRGSDVERIIESKLPIGSRHTLKELKKLMSEVYDQLNITTTPKATDILKYFEVKEVKMLEDDKRVRGFEIVKKKEG